ncbi:MAG: choline/carnitine O-acyltransferase [Micrococcus sp.]|nr:choline/carnitine O-acyltransferase [Micrococcus sp.]
MAAPAPLPVPDLDATFARLQSMVAGIAPDDAATAERVAERIRAAREGSVPGRQRALEALAESGERAGESWASAAWVAEYFAGRDPLALSTSVVFELNLPDGGAADLLYRAATVHLAQVRGESGPEENPRGAVLDPRQWTRLAGGLRHPGMPEDEFWGPRETGAAGREAGIIHAGRLYAVPVADEHGRPVAREQLAEAVGWVLTDAGPVEVPEGGAAEREVSESGASSSVAGAEPELAFTALSALGSGRLAELLPGVVADVENAAVYQRLQDLLFTVTLIPPGQDGQDDPAARLQESLTAVDEVWAYKPFSYLHHLGAGLSALHLEHSTIDGATAAAVVTRMQAAEVPSVEVTGDVTGAASGAASSSTEALTTLVPGPRTEHASVVAPERVSWTLTPQQAESVQEGLAAVEKQAERLRVRRVRTVLPDATGLDRKVSLDAVQQFVLALAQQLAFGRVRGTYESVDLREYLAGRTECVRPVTPELVALIGLLTGGEAGGAGEASAEDSAQDAALRAALDAALEAHRGWIKACKAGAGVDRHLWGLALAGSGAEGGGEDAYGELLADPAVRAARHDFLSTTSLGGADVFVRYAFVPTVAEGFGVNYTPGEEHLEFCVSFWADTAEQPEAFLAALPEAARILDETFARLSTPR